MTPAQDLARLFATPKKPLGLTAEDDLGRIVGEAVKLLGRRDAVTVGGSDGLERLMIMHAASLYATMCAILLAEELDAEQRDLKLAPLAAAMGVDVASLRPELVEEFSDEIVTQRRDYGRAVSEGRLRAFYALRRPETGAGWGGAVWPSGKEMRVR